MTLLTITAGQYCLGTSPDVFETFLGSCVGVALYDPGSRIGGLLHIILPRGMKQKQQENPAAYAESGVPFLINAMTAAGADRSRLVVTLAGGARIRTGGSGQDLKIGQRNVLALREIMRNYRIPVLHEDVGGDFGRHMTFHLADGRVDIRPSRPDTGAAKPVVPQQIDALSSETLNEAMDNLKPISDVALQALDMAREPTSSFHQLERLILQDQVLSASVLRLVNSAFYRMPIQVGTISQALAMLGLNAFRKLVLQSAVHHFFARKFHAYSMEAGALFHHSVACARIAELLLDQGATAQDRERAYLAGLLHDLGKVVLERSAGSFFPRVVDMVLYQDLEFHRAEREVLGTDHSEVGRLLVEKWRLPGDLGEAIAFHHQPSLAQESDRRLVAAVHVANLLCNMLGVGISSSAMANQADPAAFLALGLDEQAVDNLLSAVPVIIGAHA